MHAAIATDVEYCYGRTVAIAPSSFTVPAGAYTVLIGPNGAGKSTILHALAGLITPTKGTITVDCASSHRRVALVLQTTRASETLPITVREIVSMGRFATTGAFGRMSETDTAAVDTALERMAITHLASKHLSELSGGERQRVFVAQGLAQDHDILLLDEPLTGLDTPTAQAVDEVIHDEHSSGGTIVMTTHDLAEARVADHVILVAGRVVAEGRPEDVLTPDNLRAAYGSGMLHGGGDHVFFDDPAHLPAEEGHTHRSRTIHVEAMHDDGPA